MYLLRIITFMTHKSLNAPQRILEDGSSVITYNGKERVFTIRKVFYDDDMTPIYTEPTSNEQRYRSLQELRTVHPQKAIWESPILDKDHSLRVFTQIV